MNNNFISDDKLTINLPVPLGTKIYSILTKCGDFCMFQKEHFYKVFGERTDNHCVYNMPCHTRYRDPIEMTFSLQNIDYVLENWNTKCFATLEEAIDATNKLVYEHVEKMKTFGFNVDEKGYSIINKNKEQKDGNK
jgi:hypothetical protein